MTTNAERELAELERQAEQLKERRLALEKAAEEELARQEKLDALLKTENPYPTPRALVLGLIERFDIAPESLGGKDSESLKSGQGRVRMTAELRDRIKAEKDNHKTLTSLQKAFGLSYPVVKGVLDGKYDKL
jgi:hypothetical protein